jgi:hypothetical protein
MAPLRFAGLVGLREDDNGVCLLKGWRTAAGMTVLVRFDTSKAIRTKRSIIQTRGCAGQRPAAGPPRKARPGPASSEAGLQLVSPILQWANLDGNPTGAMSSRQDMDCIQHARRLQGPSRS